MKPETSSVVSPILGYAIYHPSTDTYYPDYGINYYAKHGPATERGFEKASARRPRLFNNVHTAIQILSRWLTARNQNNFSDYIILEFSISLTGKHYPSESAKRLSRIHWRAAEKAKASAEVNV